MGVTGGCDRVTVGETGILKGGCDRVICGVTG